MFKIKRIIIAAMLIGILGFPSLAQAQRGVRRSMFNSAFGFNPALVNFNSTLGSNSFSGINQATLTRNPALLNQLLINQRFLNGSGNVNFAGNQALINNRFGLLPGTPLINPAGGLINPAGGVITPPGMNPVAIALRNAQLNNFLNSPLWQNTLASGSVAASEIVAAQYANSNYSPFAFAPSLVSWYPQSPYGQFTLGRGPRAAPAATEVGVYDNQLDPRRLTLRVGDTIQWTNYSKNPHAIISDDGLFDSGGMARGSHFRYTFTETGTYGYHDSQNPLLYGTIEVRQ